MTRYEPADSFATSRFSGVRTFMRLPNARDLTNADAAIKACVSFVIAFVDPAYTPGMGRPELGGYTSREAQESVRGLAGLDIVGCDVDEVYPSYDGPGQVTALVAANVAHDSLGLLTLQKKGRDG